MSLGVPRAPLCMQPPPGPCCARAVLSWLTVTLAAGRDAPASFSSSGSPANLVIAAETVVVSSLSNKVTLVAVGNAPLQRGVAHLLVFFASHGAAHV